MGAASFFCAVATFVIIFLTFFASLINLINSELQKQSYHLRVATNHLFAQMSRMSLPNLCDANTAEIVLRIALIFYLYEHKTVQFLQRPDSEHKAFG